MSQGFGEMANRVGKDIRLRSTKIDGTLHFEWVCRLTDAMPDRLILHQPAGTSIQTRVGVWTPEFDAHVYVWRDKWFNVIQMRDADGAPGEYYCNIITPVQVRDDEITWHDLDLDVKVEGDGTYRVLDEDEWARNVEQLQYAPEVVAHARRAVDELVGAIEQRAFPFAFGREAR